MDLPASRRPTKRENTQPAMELQPHTTSCNLDNRLGDTGKALLKFVLLLASVMVTSLSFAGLLSFAVQSGLANAWVFVAVLFGWIASIVALLVIFLCPSGFSKLCSAGAPGAAATQQLLDLLLTFAAALATSLNTCTSLPAALAAAAVQTLTTLRRAPVPVQTAADLEAGLGAAPPGPPAAAATPPPSAPVGPPATPPAAFAVGLQTARRELDFGSGTSPASLAGTTLSPILLEMTPTGAPL